MPSRNGNTAVLARAALEAARAEGADTEKIVLSEHHIEYCRGCMHCMRTGTCLIDDEAFALRDKLYTSDGIILASPSYGIQMTARMKNSLVDRIGMFTVNTSSFGGKHFVGISTAGGIGAKKVARKLVTSTRRVFSARLCQRLVGNLEGTRTRGRIDRRPGEVPSSRM
ncbi:MAG: flavodoxin family protein [Spirochaetaceae bacterium]|nr:flavodoxin family protein [Spirochaetaceae bacterium]